MATFVIFDQFKQYLGDGTIDLDTDTFKIALSNAVPNVDQHTTFTDITEISAGNGYTSTGETLAGVTWAETATDSGVWQFTANDTTWTASGGSIGPFQYVVMYASTPSTPTDPLVGYLDVGSATTITDGNSFTVDVGTNGYFQLR